MSSDKLPDKVNEGEPGPPPEGPNEEIPPSDVNIEEEEKKSVSDVGEIPPPSAHRDRRKSNLTVENLKLHEEVVAKEEREKSQQGSDSPVKTISHHSVPRTSSPLAPLKDATHRTGSGGIRVPPELVQRVEDDVVSPVPSRESLRTGSGKPLPPIGSDKGGDLEAERQDSFTDESGTRAGMPRILGYKRERSNDNDNETVESESLSKSERPVSLGESQDNSTRPAPKSSKAQTRNISSPANREIIKSKNPDGTEKVGISIATETEWSWLESIRLVGKLQEDDTLAEGETKESKSQTASELSVKKRTGGTDVTDESSSELEDGLLDAQEEKLEEDEESEYSDEEVGPLPSGTMVPRIGPPRIIQYQRESEKVFTQPKDPSKRTRRRPVISLEGIEIPEEDEYVDNADGAPGSFSSRRQVRKKRSKAVNDAKNTESQSGASTPTSDMQELLGTAGGSCEFCHGEIKPFPTPEMQQTKSPDELYCCEGYQKLVEFTLENAEADNNSEELIDIAPHAPYGSKQARRAAKERAAARLREREMARQKAAGANQQNFYASHRLEILDGVARQMKTINYSLSSQRCMDEGWTLRPPTPSDDGNYEPDPYEAQPVFHMPLMALKQRKPNPDEQNIISKKYGNGQYFMVMFEDGTGTIFYQSGNAAIIITSPEKGQYQYIVQEDTQSRGNLLAVFEPNGKATCYQNNGQIKLNLTSYGGIYLDQKGGVKKRWLWKDPVTHTHAPPFQPVCFALNKFLSLRCMGQDQIFLQFNQEKQTIRFNVGVKLKLVKPENLPQDDVDEHLLRLSDIKAYFKVITDKIHNAIKYSKSPKLDNLRPPYKVQKDLIRNEKLKTKKVQQQVSGKGAPVVTVN